MSPYKQYCTPCQNCGSLTSKAYARKSSGKCKACNTGEVSPSHSLRCPDCGQHTLTVYQKAHGYHCDSCTRQADPEGWRREVMGLNDSDGGY